MGAHILPERENSEKTGKMMRNNILFTGSPGCGKTTLIKKIVEGLPAPTTGFFTQEIRERGKRVGFTINTLAGTKVLLAHINVSGWYRVGRYGVALENVDRIAVESIIPKTPNVKGSPIKGYVTH